MELTYAKIKLSNIRRPLIIWDGNCSFCHYWILRAEKIIGDAIRYEPYQKAEKYITEITEKEFKESVKLIDSDGNVYSGAAAIFKALSYKPRGSWLFSFYINNFLFRKLSDLAYKTVSAHRPFAYKVTVALWGRNPLLPKKRWLGYIILSTALIAGWKIINNKDKSH